MDADVFPQALMPTPSTSASAIMPASNNAAGMLEIMDEQAAWYLGTPDAMQDGGFGAEADQGDTIEELREPRRRRRRSARRSGGHCDD